MTAPACPYCQKPAEYLESSALSTELRVPKEVRILSHLKSRTTGAQKVARRRSSVKEMKMNDQNTEAFSCGLTDEEEFELDQLRIDIRRITQRIEALPRHRSLSLAITKMEEAEHWLRDRMGKPA